MLCILPFAIMFLSFLCNTFSPIVYLDSDIVAYPVHSIKFGYRIFAYFVSPLVLLWLLSASTWISFNHIQDYVFTWGKFGCFSLLFRCIWFDLCHYLCFSRFYAFLSLWHFIFWWFLLFTESIMILKSEHSSFHFTSDF